MRREARGDLGVERGEARRERLELTDQQLHQQLIRGQNRPVARERLRDADGGEPRRDLGRRPAMVRGVEVLDALRTRALNGSERGPALEEGQRHRGTQVLARPLERLREVVLEGGRQLLRESGAQVDGPPATLHQVAQRPRRLVGRDERAEAVAMGRQEFPQQVGVRHIVFGPARRERLAEALEAPRIDRIEQDVRMREQGVDERPSRGLDGDAQRARRHAGPSVASQAVMASGVAAMRSCVTGAPGAVCHATS